MFKRVEKRQRKKQEEEDLGLDDELKEIMGLQDTDSEESDSDSDIENGSEGSGEEAGNNEHLGNNSEVAEGSSGEEQEEEEEEEDPDVSVSNALTDPVYVVSIDPDVKACIVCPGKLLKGANMVQTHRTSKAHERRYKQFKEIAVDAEKNESAWLVLKRHAEDNPKLSLAPSTPGTSKRGEKKKRYLERQKAKRDKIKQLKAKKTAEKKYSEETKPDHRSDSEKGDTPPKQNKENPKTNPSVSTVTPPKKRRKVVASSKPGDTSPNQPTRHPSSKTTDLQPSALMADKPAIQPVKGGGKKVVADIVRSTANRALAARSKSTGKRKSLKVS